MATIHSLRERLSGKISQIENIDLLELLLQLADDEQGKVPFQLTEEQENAVSKGLDEFENGHYIPDWEADKEVSRWLKNVKF